MPCRVRRYCQPSETVELSEYDEALLAEGPVLYLPLSGGASGAIDQTGNGHDGTPIGAIGQSTFPNGDGSTVFDGLTQYIEIQDADELSVPTTGIITIEGWIRPDVLEFPDAEGTGDYVYWAGKLASGQDEYALRMYSYTTPGVVPARSNRQSGYAFNLSGGLGAGSYAQDVVVAGEWDHLLLVINTVNVDSTYTTGYTKFYKNGVLRDKDKLSDYSIIPGNGTANLRVGAATLSSFFKGAIAKFAVWDFEPAATDILARYRLVVPAVGGTATFLGHVGTASTTSAGTKLSITVGESGVPAGATLIAKVSNTYTAVGPTMGDNKGNIYTRDRTAANTGLTTRTSIFSAPINAALVAGDVIQMSLSTSVAVREFGVDAFTGITFSSPLDQSNSGQGTSTTPGTSTIINTTFANSLVYGMATVEGPITDLYTEDVAAEYTALTRVGTNSGSNDITSNSAYKSIAVTGALKYQPTLGTSRNWLSMIANYKAGTPVIVPPVIGSATYLGMVGSNTSTVSGTTMLIVVIGDGVPAGHTLIMPVGADYTAAGPTATDIRGNVWTRDRTSPATGNTSRSTIFSCPVTTPLIAGDTITITWAAAVVRKAAAIHEFAGVLIPTVINTQNGNAGTGTSPSVSVTTTLPDILLFGYVMAEGPVTEAYEPDIVNTWSPLTRVGTTGGGVSTDDRTIDAGYRSVNAVLAPSVYNPQLGVSTKYVAMQMAYRGG